MGKRGPPPLPPGVVALRGTARGDRARELVVEPLKGEVTPPAWLADEALKIFWRKVSVYQRRGQAVVGLEDALAHYSQLEFEIIDAVARRVEITAAQRNLLVRWQIQFYDTPASQIGTASPNKPNNPFTRNGKKPS